ncbi:MAG: T9SS type A sorting domain-containing protein [Chitinophagales bacterium]|nr:T9SS type A sorting domain-containing protein [Chitinophagales bacterium]
MELPAAARNKKVRLMVYDVTGAVVYQENIMSSGTYTLHLNQQPKGIYWLSLSDDSEDTSSVYIDKLVLQ